MITWMNIFVKTHQTVHFKHARFIVCKLHLSRVKQIKSVFLKKKKKNQLHQSQGELVKPNTHA